MWRVFASASRQPFTVCREGWYVICPIDAADASLVNDPVDGGRPKAPSLPSSVIASTLSHDRQLLVTSRLDVPNHDGAPARKSSGRMLTIVGKKICCSEKRSNSGAFASRKSNVIDEIGLPIGKASYAALASRRRPSTLPTLCSSSTARDTWSPF